MCIWKNALWISKTDFFLLSQTPLFLSAWKKIAFYNISLLFLSTARRRVKVRFGGKYRRVSTRRRWVVKYGKRKYQIRGFRRGRLTIRVLKKSRPIVRLGRYWYIRYGRKRLRVKRRGRRRYIRWRRRTIYLRWRFRIRFKGVRRIVRCRGRRWSIKYGRTWRRIRKRRVRFVKKGRRRYPIWRRRGKYRVRVGKRWKKVKVRRRRRSRRRRRRRRKL